MRVLGVSAPHNVYKPSNDVTQGLSSRDPFSLYNAFRICAEKAEGTDIYWHQSNWNSFSTRTYSIILMEYYYNDVHIFIDRVTKIKPNLLLISAMSLSFAGAIELAKLAKDILKNDVFIVLGGKHINETIFSTGSEIKHLNNSPTILMQSRKIPRVFDMVVSGDGEEILWQIGRAVGHAIEHGLPLSSVYEYKDFNIAKGYWIISWLDGYDNIFSYKSENNILEYDNMKPTSDLFKISTKFNVFSSPLTAHTMSYLSPGCVFNCDYCSEGYSCNGELRQKGTAPNRLYKNLDSIAKVGVERYKVEKMSAFIEDSILLGGFTELLDTFVDLLTSNPINISWGCQFTIDKLMSPDIRKIVRKLTSFGLEYIFVGLETIDEVIAGNLSKSKSINDNSWRFRNESVIEFVETLGIKYGVSILFGLGESQLSRLQLLEQITKWRETYSIPSVVSFNLAVQHPLRKHEEYDYTRWGTSFNSKYLEMFTSIFGEASEEYPLINVPLPTIEELEELRGILCANFNLK